MDIRFLVKNLVDNASRYTPQSGRVDISLADSNGRVILDVDGTGAGIPSHDRDRVFDHVIDREPDRSRHFADGDG